VIGKPQVAKRRIQEFGLENLDYFAFAEHVREVRPVKFWDDFRQDVRCNEDKYRRVHDLLSDDESRDVFSRIVHFRLFGTLETMRVFTDCQHRQYFEQFLELESEGETFVDVGGFDGFTSDEFIKRCPGYRTIFFFEPDAANLARAKTRLSGHQNIEFFQAGLAEQRTTMRFQTGGSTSQICADGPIEIEVVPLDDVVKGPISFLKMDVEGAELPAIRGAIRSVRRDHPRLAISVYHLFDDLWKIPEQVLEVRDDYRLYLRHYTEGVDETVMYFVPTDVRR